MQDNKPLEKKLGNKYWELTLRNPRKVAQGTPLMFLERMGKHSDLHCIHIEYQGHPEREQVIFPPFKKAQRSAS